MATEMEDAMADPPREPEMHDADGEAAADIGPGSPPGLPRWVKVFGIIAAVLVVVVAIVMLTGGPGGHGPGRHG